MLVVLTGGAGRVGRALVPELRAEGYDVRTFDVNPTETGGAWEHVTGDLRDLETVRRVVSGADVIVHGGAIGGDIPGQADRVLTANTQGTWNVLIAAVEAGVTRVVHFSSVTALGCFGGMAPAIRLPIDDSYPKHPQHAYGLSKHLGEELCRAFIADHGIVTISLRPALITGPSTYAQWRADATAADAALWHCYWAYVDERDVCDATLLAIDARGVAHDRFLLCAADTCSPTPTADLLAERYPDTPWPEVDRDTYLRDAPYRTLIDCTHAADVLGWHPRRSWREATQGAPAGQRRVRRSL
jgi:nucleoside-diphosphate-sugar epimerase